MKLSGADWAARALVLAIAGVAVSACATAVDSAPDPSTGGDNDGGGADADATSDAPYHPRDSGTPYEAETPYDSGNPPPFDSGNPPPFDAGNPPPFDAGAFDSGFPTGDGGGTACSSDPKYLTEYLNMTTPKLCQLGCSATECCFQSLVCLPL